MRLRKNDRLIVIISGLLFVVYLMMAIFVMEQEYRHIDSAYDNDYKYLVDLLAVLYPVLVIYSIFDQDHAETTRNEKRTLLIKSFILITALIVYLKNWADPIFYIWSLFRYYVLCCRD